MSTKPKPTVRQRLASYRVIKHGLAAATATVWAAGLTDDEAQELLELVELVEAKQAEQAEAERRQRQADQAELAAIGATFRARLDAIADRLRQPPPKTKPRRSKKPKEGSPANGQKKQSEKVET